MSKQLNDPLELQKSLQSMYTQQNVANLIASQFRWNDPSLNSLDKVVNDARKLQAFSDYYTLFKRIEGKIFKKYSFVDKLSNIGKYYALEYRIDPTENDATKENVEEVKQAAVIETRKVSRLITDIYRDNSILFKLTPRNFEEMIAEILSKDGYEVELTKQTRDNGYDIIAIKTINKDFPIKMLVECKRFYKQKISVDIIRSFKEVVQANNVNKGLIVTTSYFTRDAHAKRKETPYLLDYRDKDDVINWVKEYCEKD